MRRSLAEVSQGAALKGVNSRSNPVGPNKPGPNKPGPNKPGPNKPGTWAAAATRPYNDAMEKLMRRAVCSLVLLAGLPVCAQALAAPADGTERLGTVTFAVSCTPSSQLRFNRGVALQHDFWYDEARAEFGRIAASDPTCAMAHWGTAMSVFHQIWNRPSEQTMAVGWAEMQKALASSSPAPRERGYIAALAGFYRPGPDRFPARIAAYSAAMGELYRQYPDDVDAGAFYALSLLAAQQPGDTSLNQQHRAMEVLQRLFVQHPDNPGVDHYITHACDNPAMAAEGLAASDHYLEIAQSGPHAYHMPGHIYARLGLWQKDIDSQLGSIQAAEAAETHGEGGLPDEPHSYDFLAYAYLQSGQEALARMAITHLSGPLGKMEAMPGMASGHMEGMVPYYQVKLPVFYDLEMRDWKAAAALEPPAHSNAEVETLVFWARAVGHGHSHDADGARADLARYDRALGILRKGKTAYTTEGSATRIERGEIVAWVAFARNDSTGALAAMRAAADLQDKVGQGEVDIPAREMLADMLLEGGQAGAALAEYRIALQLSPNRLNGLANAGRAAEQAGEKQAAGQFYGALLASTRRGAESSRPEIAHARDFMAKNGAEASAGGCGSH